MPTLAPSGTPATAPAGCAWANTCDTTLAAAAAAPLARTVRRLESIIGYSLVAFVACAAACSIDRAPSRQLNAPGFRRDLDDDRGQHESDDVGAHAQPEARFGNRERADQIGRENAAEPARIVGDPHGHAARSGVGHELGGERPEAREQAGDPEAGPEDRDIQHGLFR